MTLSNNQIGKIQLILQELLWLQRIEELSQKNCDDFIWSVYELFQTQELQQLSSDLKDVYNSGLPVELVEKQREDL